MTDDNQTPGNDDNQNQNTPATLSPEDLAKLIKQNTNGQDFIDTLKSEKRDLETRLQEAEQKVQDTQSISELLEQMREKTYEPNSNEPTAPQLDKNELLAELEQQILGRMTANQQQQAMEQNLASTLSVLEEQHGEGYGSYIAQRAKELDMTDEQVAQMAATSPKAFLDLMNTTQKSSGAPTTPSGRAPILDVDVQAESEFDKIAKLQKNLDTPEGREARQMWNDPEWQKKQRARIIEDAKKEGRL